MNIQWELTDYLSGTYGNLRENMPLAVFDLDGTLIETKSGKIMPIDSNDWLYRTKNVITKLQDYNKTHQVVIITNQMGLVANQDRYNNWKAKLKTIATQINIPLYILVSIANDQYRKPMPSFWTVLKSLNYNSISFYCGDAMGRKNDHSDSDLKFALNGKIPFKTPEEIFENRTINIPPINYKAHDEIKKYSVNLNQPFVPKDKEIIILVGFPGSGKSSLTKELLKHQYTSINQDTLKTKAKCIKECEKLMKENKSIIIDNTNPSVDARKVYIDLAKKMKYYVRVFVFDVSMEFAIHNAKYRVYKNIQKMIPSIAYNMYRKNYSEPTKAEGIDEIVKYYPYITDYNEDYILYYD